MRRFLLVDVAVIVTLISQLSWFSWSKLSANHNQTRLG